MLPYATVLATVAIAGAAGAIPRPWWLALAGSALAAGTGAGLRSWIHRLALCDLADRFLATGEGDPPAAAVLGERRAMLVSDRDRRDTALGLRQIVAASAVVADAALIERLADRIERLGIPVSARAMALDHLLLTDAASPIYGDTGAGHDGLRRALVRIELELR